jgi:hypothetical protein
MARLTGRLTITFDLLEQLQGAVDGAATLTGVTLVSRDDAALTLVVDVDKVT